MFRHALVRSFVLVALGVFLRSDGRDQTYFTFEDVLSQIGLGYTFLFLLWGRPTWVQFLAAFGDSGRVLGTVLLLSRCRPLISTTRRSAWDPIGRTWKASPHTGTRTPTRPTTSTFGF